MTNFHAHPQSPPASRAESPPACTASAGRLRRAIAREDVFAVDSRVERLWLRSVDKEGGKRREGEGRTGAQHVGTGMGLGDIKGRKLGGSKRRLAARKRVAVVKVIANATAKRS